MFSLGLNAPGLFATYPCSPTVCADIYATARARTEEGDIDGIVRNRFTPEDGKPQQPLAGALTGSRLLRQVAEVCSLSGETDPFNAMTAIMRELKELRSLKETVQQATGQLSIDAAMSTIEVTMRERAELRNAETAFGTSLGADGWRAVAAEVEAGRHLEQRVRAFAGVTSGSNSSVEAALRTLHHREKERLSLIQLRTDVLAVAGQALSAQAAKTAAGEPTAEAVKAVRDLVEASSSLKAATRQTSLREAIAALRKPSTEQVELTSARRRLRRLHTQLLVASRSLPHALHRHYLGEASPPMMHPPATPSAAPPGSGRGAVPASAERGDGDADGGGGRSERGESSRRRKRSARGADGAGTEGQYSERDYLVDGEEDTADEDDEEEDGQRAWRKRALGTLLGTLLGSDKDKGGAEAESNPPAGVHIPKLPLAPAAAPASEPPTSAQRKKGNSARPASPRGVRPGGMSSPRGSPPARTGSSASARPSAAPSKSKPRPPTAPAPAPSAGGLSLGGISIGLAASNGVSEGLGSGLASAWSSDYAVTTLIGIGTRSLVHEARRLGGGADDPRAAALCALVLDDDSWDSLREELKALSNMGHPSVMRIHGWYERRLPPSPSRPGAYEVSVAAQLMHGGDLLQRACASRYTEHDVRMVAVTIAEAFIALEAASVRRIDIAPWSLLYELPASGSLHEGLVITNAAFGAPLEARARALPLRSAFDAPEVQSGAKQRELPAAMYTLGKVIELLLLGDTREDSQSGDKRSARSASDGGDGGGGGAGEVEHISAEARVLIEALCRPAPIARPRPRDLLHLPWIARQRSGSGDGGGGGAPEAAAPPPDNAPSAAPSAGAVPANNLKKLYSGDSGAAGSARASTEGAAAPATDASRVPSLTGAHERLNRWYDEFLFEGMTVRLAACAEG